MDPATDDPSADTSVADRQYAANLAQWDERAPAHAASPDYNLAGYVADPDHLSGVVAFDLPLLRLVDRPERLAASYTLQARKPD